MAWDLGICLLPLASLCPIRLGRLGFLDPFFNRKSHGEVLASSFLSCNPPSLQQQKLESLLPYSHCVKSLGASYSQRLFDICQEGSPLI